ncbi:MAG: transcription antitermination factor NusB [Tepidisphaeraceae bacterium]
MNARDFALIQLDGKRLPGWKPNLVRKRKPSEPRDPRDWALAEQIVNGVVKSLLSLQRDIQHYSGKSAAQIDPLVAKILAVAIYQLKFLDRIPAPVAVDEAVEQTKRFGRPRSAGFVNAVLRNVGRQPPPPIPDVESDPEGYAQFVLSHPPELFRRLVALLGNERALAFCRHDNAEPPTIVRLFKGIEPSALKAPGVEILPHHEPGLFVVREARRAVLAQWASEGLAQVQDATAAGVVEQMRISPGQRVLDRCAGLGTKTMQIQERVGPSGQVLAVDPSEFRCATLMKMLKPRHISNVNVLQVGKLAPVAAEIPGSFDRILIDVPCSNSGVLARRPEARYASGLDCLLKIQRDILDDSLPWLGSDGLLVYSTCSVWPEENELQIKQFMDRHSGLDLILQDSILPSSSDPQSYHDGGYLAVLEKRF